MDETLNPHTAGGVVLLLLLQDWPVSRERCALVGVGVAVEVVPTVPIAAAMASTALFAVILVLIYPYIVTVSRSAALVLFGCHDDLLICAFNERPRLPIPVCL